MERLDTLQRWKVKDTVWNTNEEGCQDLGGTSMCAKRQIGEGKELISVIDH